MIIIKYYIIYLHLPLILCFYLIIPLYGIYILYLPLLKSHPMWGCTWIMGWIFELRILSFGCALIAKYLFWILISHLRVLLVGGVGLGGARQGKVSYQCNVSAFLVSILPIPFHQLYRYPIPILLQVSYIQCHNHP